MSGSDKAGRQRNIDSNLYLEDWFHSLSRPARELWFYLSFNHHNNLSGAYKITFPYIRFETSMSEDEVYGAILELEAAGEITYWDNYQMVFVHRFFTTQAMHSSRTIAGARNAMKKFPAEVVEAMCEVHPQLRTSDEDSEADTVSIPYRYRIDTSLSGTGTGTGTEPVREEKRRTSASGDAQERAFSLPEGRRAQQPALGSVEAQFQRNFYARYPKKRNRKRALQVWRELDPSEELQREITIALARQIDLLGWDRGKDHPGYARIPLPENWLAGKRWLDEFPETKPASKTQGPAA